MEIMQVPFEEALTIELNGKQVQLYVYKTQEAGNIKVGVQAPRNVSVDREEIAEQKKLNNP